jgi:serine/threonine-protein kinase
MGEVYLAAARSIEGAERPLIIKSIRKDHIDDRSFVARFLDEARIQAQLQHPGVAQILEATTDAGGKPYVVVEYVEGRNLSDVRTRAGQLGVRITWPEALALGVCLGEALSHVHERTDSEGRPLEIVHRDLSPQNVMLGYGGDVKLIDFGTARGQNRRCQTIAGVVFAKPGYVAPEVANNLPGGVPADLYAFGVILWELLAGRRFLSGEATAHLAAVGAGKRSLPPLARVVGAPPEIDALLARLTATRMEDRYLSARQALQDLVRLLQRAPSLADGDRSVRGRISDLMRRLYPAEPAKSRSDFARRVAEARAAEPRLALVPPSPLPPETSDPSLLAGTRYRLVREIGRGAMGVVHEAVHLDLARTVALKVLEAEAMSPTAQTRFRAEARAIAQLSHDNLVEVFDFGVCGDGRLYYAMQLLDGETLSARLDREGRLPAQAVVDFGIQACRALSVAHQAGVVHRDIKPANLFVTRTGTLKVLDFGVASATDPTTQKAASAEGVCLHGTPEYMAPEQARGQADAASDVYALATVMFELLTGTLPFDAENALALLACKASSPVPRLQDRMVRIPAALEKTLIRALDADPAERPASAADFARELEAALMAPKARTLLRRRVSAAAVSTVLFLASALLVHAGLRHPEVRHTLSHGTEIVVTKLSGFAKDVQQRRADVLKARAAATSSAKPASASGSSGARTEPRASVQSTPVAPSVEPSPESVDSMAPTDATNAADTAEPSDESGLADAAAPANDAVQALLAEVKTLEARGRDLAALDRLRRAAKQHPESSPLLGALVQSLTKTGSWGEALRVARRRAELDSGVEAQLDLIRIERATGHRERALAVAIALSGQPDAPAEAHELLRTLRGGQAVALRD